MIIVTPYEFKEAFLQIATKRQQDIISKWTDPKACTDLMLDEQNGVCAEIASSLKLNYYREYWTIDAVFYEKRSSKYFDDKSFFAQSISVALEHENYGNSAHNEIHKLTIINAPLRVLITYPNIRTKDEKTLLGEFAEIVREGDIFFNFSCYRKLLVVFGYKDHIGEKVKWEFFLFGNGSFSLI